MMSYEPSWLLFASDPERLVLAASGFFIVAVFALVMDRRRHRRDRVGMPDRVGWVPWTNIFLLCAVLGSGLVAASLR